ncbi:flagellar protein FlaG [Halobacillus sp. HZG1]|uniref:flagellar protein FlaG n=1 Tax=Halobacillus sp. HZG1 TaxID=3111769 RepID=UPI002DB65AFF|nr:flagellar protein FlaG [Halobacillus sp. HZG1]MEC3882772.1 flagellar protein FlaG [Halobacillus sp. HZG1]
MNIRNISSHSQLLQRNQEQLGVRSSVQEKTNKIEVSQHELPNSDQKEKLIKATDSMNEILKKLETSLRFQFHEKLEEYYVTIVDNQTEQVIKEIPPRKMLDMYASIIESIGIMVDDKI